MPGLTDLVPDELLEWFACEIDEGYAPELHLVGLRDGELVRCFDALQRCAPQWSDRTFHIDAEGIEATVAERPEVAELVAGRRASHACIGAHGITVDVVTLPLVEMFLFLDEIQFFWWPSPDWTRERVAAFFALMLRLLDTTQAGALRPDPAYPPEARRKLAEAMARLVGDATRIDLGDRSPGDS